MRSRRISPRAALPSARRARDRAYPESSYTARLLQRGTTKIAQKLGEEAVEAVIETVRRDREGLVRESADLLYHLLVVLHARGIAFSEVEEALAARVGSSGLQEKAARPRD